MAVVIAAIALMAGVTVWLLLSDGSGAAGQPSIAGIAGSEATPQAPASEPSSETGSEPQSVTTEETRAERLARLRKTDAFVEFANFDRARTAPNYERALGAFSWYDARRDSYVGFINAKQLWNQIAPPVRDDLLLQGDEYRGPILDDRVKGGITGSYERRGERSQLIAFLAPFKDADGAPMGRVNAVMIAVSDQREDDAYARGRLLTRMKPFTVAPEDYTTNADLAERGISPRLRTWAKEHGG